MVASRSDIILKSQIGIGTQVVVKVNIFSLLGPRTCCLCLVIRLCHYHNVIMYSHTYCSKGSVAELLCLNVIKQEGKLLKSKHTH